MRSLGAVILVVLVILGVSVVPALGQTDASFCPNGITTTLGQEGLPNLYRLGLRYGVPWEDIQAASGVEDVRRVLPEQPLCVPGATGVATGGVDPSVADTTVVIIVEATATPTLVPTPTPMPMPTATAAAMTTTTTATFTEQSYCAGFLPVAIPIDLGSCQLELLSIQLGQLGIMQTGIECEPRTLGTLEDGTPVQCSVRGDIWLSTQ